MKPLRLIVAGSRDFTDRQLLFDTLDRSFGHLRTRMVIISGHARGADTLGEEWADSRQVEKQVMPADWERLGKAAGYQRNAEMAKAATHCIVFWNGQSRGTKHMIDLAISCGLWVKVIQFNR